MKITVKRVESIKATRIHLDPNAGGAERRQPAARGGRQQATIPRGRLTGCSLIHVYIRRNPSMGAQS